jgi:alkylresorcinol/alkylpyrone synthase
VTALLQALGTAMPERVYKQNEIVESFFGRLPGWQAGWGEVFEASGVERRSAVIDVHAFYAQQPSTAERMRAFAPAARQLGAEAARRALDRAGPEAAAEVGDLVVVSCTGYAGPGLDVHLAGDLGLGHGTRRLALGHMGCYAALPALRTAAALVAASGQRALVVSVELCSLHLQPATSRQDAVSQALFGDGAAAALIAPGSPGAGGAAAGPMLAPPGAGPAGGAAEPPGLTIVAAQTATLPGSEDRMGWLIGDDGFHMSLSPRVPALVDRGLGALVDQLLRPHGLAHGDVAHWAVHPGGPEILDRVQRRLGLSDAQLAPSREVLADGGNRSSATVLFILESLVGSGELRPGQWLVILGFGTGLTLEALLLRT